jgi:nucleoside-diphosphate-sugar epimerase
MAKNIFMTGASGFLGRNLLAKMLEGNLDNYYFLVRSNKAEKLIHEKIKKIEKINLNKINYVYGDITHPNCGLDSIIRDELNSHIDEVWHMAASTVFDESKRAEIVELNINGTQRVISLASKFRELKKFFYVSTAYVCGRDNGDVKEEALSEERDFRNPYEESKLKAENQVRNSSMPYIIIRPSILMGDSKTGNAEEEDRMVYGYMWGVYFSALPSVSRPRKENFWKYWEQVKNPSQYKELDTRFRADANTGKNLVTIDDMINICLAIQSDESNLKKTYNVVNPKDISVGDIVDTMQETLHVRGIKYIPNLPPEEIREGTAEAIAFKRTEPYWPYVHGSEGKWRYDNVSNLHVPRVEMSKPLLHFLLSTYVEKCLKPQSNGN